jgi:hypothetical protein
MSFTGKQRDLLNVLAKREEELDIGSSVEKEMTDAMAELTDVFGEGGYGGTGTYTGGSASGTGSGKSHGGAVTLASDMAKLRDDLQRMRHDLHNMHGRGLPNINEYGGLSTMQVGKSSGKYKHTVRHFNPETYSEYIVEFDDGLNYRVTSNTGDTLSTGRIHRLITNKLREEAEAGLRIVAEDVHQQIVQRMRERVNAPKPPKPRKSDIADELAARYEHQHFMEEKSELFHFRTLLGGKGDPIALRTDASVAVSGRNMFGRKYTVKIDGNAMYVPKIELHLKYCFDDDRLVELVESRTDEEKQALKKLLEGLIALKIAEEHHTKLIELL